MFVQIPLENIVPFEACGAIQQKEYISFHIAGTGVPGLHVFNVFLCHRSWIGFVQIVSFCQLRMCMAHKLYYQTRFIILYKVVGVGRGETHREIDREIEEGR